MTSFSIVTVVYNDITHIKETMDSIVGQSYKKVEYILIDGGSTDGTKENIIDHISSCASITLEESKDERYYLEAIHKDHPTFSFKFLSEKDKGIYDAMNKGIALATNKWINFMNCGDKFYNSSVLDQVNKRDIQKYDVLYGDFCLILGKKEIIQKSDSDPKNLYKLFRGFCHQSFFFKTTVHKAYPYSLSYKLANDYKLIYDLFSLHKTFSYIPSTICYFTCGGNTDKYAFLSLKEGFEIAKAHNNSFILLYKIYYLYLLGLARKIIKKTLYILGQL